MPQASAQRTIDPDLVYEPPSYPADPSDGAVFPIDKPLGSTSFDIVQEVRRLTDQKKVGHAGTLDPLATGLMVVLVARPATRLQDAFMHLPKTYTATVRLGESTPSHDAETEVVERVDASHLSSAEIEQALSHFVGAFEQVPPMYSAIKVDGERLYKRARRGETVERHPRPVEIYEARVTDIDAADVSMEVTCSKGTYIRSLARDIGENLGVGGHLTRLRRTAIGDYHVDRAWALPALREAADQPAQ